MSHRVVGAAEIPPAKDPDGELDWRPVRHHLDVTAFGVNAYGGAQPGDLVIEDHDEDEAEELYVVLRGGVRFAIDGEEVDAPQGTLVLVTPPSRRVAHATEPDTLVLAVGAVPGRAFAVSDWEKRWLAADGSA
jgi:mannose-6-phosphate isomerase-like protein (cupin superfamily)